MSNLDKTGKKLIDSIRMTKKGSATAAVKSATKKKTTRKAAKSKKSPATSKSKSAVMKVKETNKASPKGSTKPNSTAASRKNPPRKKTTPLADIPFQDGSQVWPD